RRQSRGVGFGGGNTVLVGGIALLAHGLERRCLLPDRLRPYVDAGVDSVECQLASVARAEAAEVMRIIASDAHQRFAQTLLGLEGDLACGFDVRVAGHFSSRSWAGRVRTRPAW